MSRHARLGFLVAIVLGFLSLPTVFFQPMAGLLAALMYFGAAWGIRGRRPGAALAIFAAISINLVVSASRISGSSKISEWLALAAVGIFALVCAGLMLLAWLDLRRDPARRGPDWPWYLIPGSMLVFWICFQPFTMPSASMEHTVLPGDCFLVDRIHTGLGQDPQRGEIIAHLYPLNHKEVYVKRVVGIPGDRLHLVHKQLLRNGSLVPEPYVIHSSTMEDSYRDNFPAAPNVPLPEPALKMLAESVSDGEVVVPKAKYFVMGDNRDDSADSRYWGFVDRSEVIGQPVLIYDSHSAQPGTVLNLRWDRLFKRP